MKSLISTNFIVFKALLYSVQDSINELSKKYNFVSFKVLYLHTSYAITCTKKVNSKENCKWTGWLPKSTFMKYWVQNNKRNGQQNHFANNFFKHMHQTQICSLNIISYFKQEQILSIFLSRATCKTCSEYKLVKLRVFSRFSLNYFRKLSITCQMQHFAKLPHSIFSLLSFI